MKKLCFAAAVLFVLVTGGCQQQPGAPSSSEKLPDTSSSVAEAPQQPETSIPSAESLETGEPEIFTLGDQLTLDPGELCSFLYEELSPQEERSVMLTGKDAVRAMESLLEFQISIQQPGDEDPIVGGAKRYTMEFSSGETVMIYDVGMLSINEEENIYKREDQEQLVLPEDPDWTVYHVDLITGEKSEIQEPPAE